MGIIMKKLSVGIQTIAELINEDYHYVDKTPLIEKMATTGKHYFLSRPRRFGKSLLISTLKSAFAGEEALFKGLYLEKNWDWSKKYPIIHIDFAGGVVDGVDALRENFQVILDDIAEDYGIQLKNASPNNRLNELIRTLHRQTAMPVVVLVDEYDKPILDNILKPETATAIREELRNIYSTLKHNDAHLKFTLLTGVSKFSKISLFSGLNNLEDISLNPDYATLCGYTGAEIKKTFADYAKDTDFEQLRQWYNGYNFLGERVYNPFDVLLYFKSGEFENYWFETGSPSFLLKLVRERQYNLPDMENICLFKSHLGSFDIDDITLDTVLFQTGYLTIERMENVNGNKAFYLTYPNREVKASLNQHLLRDLTRLSPSGISSKHIQIQSALMQTDFASLKQAFNTIFASIPHDWYRKNQMANYEGYYASIVYSCFCALGLTVIAEDSTSQGRIDLTVKMQNKVFIIEFKALDKNDENGTALAQIKQKNYQQKYLSAGNEVFLLGMEFDREQRNLSFFEWESS